LDVALEEEEEGGPEELQLDDPTSFDVLFFLSPAAFN